MKVLVDKKCPVCDSTPYLAYDNNRHICTVCFVKRTNLYKRPYVERLSVKDRWIRYTIANAKRRAKQHHLPFDLDKQWITCSIVDVCPVFDISLDYSLSKVADNSPSLDRHIPENGYTKDNCSIISMKANRIKNNATYDELLKVAKWLEKRQL